MTTGEDAEIDKEDSEEERKEEMGVGHEGEKDEDDKSMRMSVATSVGAVIATRMRGAVVVDGRRDGGRGRNEARNSERAHERLDITYIVAADALSYA